MSESYLPNEEYFQQQAIVVTSSGRCRRSQLRQAQKKHPFYGLLKTRKKRSKRKKS